MRRGSLAQGGLALTEVLLALALLIPVIALVAGLFPYSFSVDRKAWNKRTAQSLGRSAIERCRGTKFDELVSFTQTHPPEAGQGGPTYTVRVDVTSLPFDSPDVREKKVNCRVSWPEKYGMGELILESRVAKMFQPAEEEDAP